MGGTVIIVGGEIAILTEAGIITGAAAGGIVVGSAIVVGGVSYYVGDAIGTPFWYWVFGPDPWEPKLKPEPRPVPVPVPEPVDTDCDEDPPKKPVSCTKASPFHLEEAGIDDAHDFKTGWGDVPNSKYDICACTDGSVSIAAQGKCGKPGPKIDTDVKWRDD